MEVEITIRQIEKKDNAALAVIIRTSLAEFGADKPGTVYYDPTTDNLSELFRQPGSVYFVLLQNGALVGGAGIFPSEGLPQGTCELVKMYLAEAVRGKGYGKMLIEKCLRWAGDFGYGQVYIETLPELRRAVTIYEKFGFKYLGAPLGNTGHFGCDIWMLKKLKNS